MFEYKENESIKTKREAIKLIKREFQVAHIYMCLSSKSIF